jgi:beta propeller repeat protein
LKNRGGKPRVFMDRRLLSTEIAGLPSWGSLAFFIFKKEVIMKKLNFAFALTMILFSWSFTISSVSAYQFESAETQLTTDQNDQFDPSISGAITVYSDRRAVDADIYYYDIENNEEVRITEGSSDQLLNDVSGNFIVYTSYGAENAHIVLYNIETAVTQQITNFASNQRKPSISGDLVVYEDDRNGNFDIYLYNLTSEVETQLTFDTSHQRKPDISGQIVVWEDYRNGNADIFMMDISVKNPVEAPVADDLAQDVDPDVDGNIIVYGSNRNSVGDIYLYRISDRLTVPVTATVAYERNPNVSGDYVAYESYAGGDSDIWLYSISLGVSELATIDPAEQYLNAISSNRLVYTDNRNDNLDIYLLEFQFLSDIEVSPSSYNFGDVELGSSSLQIVTITNTGNESCIFSIALKSGSSSDFNVTFEPSGLSAEPSGTVDVKITFSPISEGISSAILEINSNIPNPAVDVQLSGNGVPVEDPPEEQITSILDFINESVDAGTLTGTGNGNSAGNRLNALINMIEAAGDLIEAGDIDGACGQLMAVYKKCDGEDRPPDFVAGIAAAGLASLIIELMSSLGC